jgi:hypothetical protein
MAEDEERRSFLSVIPTIVACVISALWAVSFLMDMVNPKYDPHPSITPVMLSAAGFLFSREFLTRWAKNGKHKAEETK